MAKDLEGSPPDIHAAVFDLDGLLVNTEELYQDVGSELLRRRGKTFDADLLDAMMGRPQQKALSIMIEWHGLADTVETLASETKDIFQNLLSTRLALMPGAKELIEHIRLLDITLGVATSRWARVRPRCPHPRWPHSQLYFYPDIS